MAFTRKQLVTCVSLVYLVLVTAISGYALYRTKWLSSPISDLLAGFTTALPIIAGLLLEGGYKFAKHRNSRPRGQTPRPPSIIIANTIIFIYSSVVITLLGTHATPASGLNCKLEEGWKKMFSHKNAEGIRTIQDVFNCCGFVNSHDMAWPFPDRSHDVHSCESAFGRKTGCLGPWKSEEQNKAGILMSVVGLVFIWQFAIIIMPTERESWLHRVLPDRVSNLISDEEQGSSNGPRRAIDYPSNFSRHYSDNGVEELTGDAVESTPQRGESTQEARNAITGTSEEEEESERHPILDDVWGRN